MNLMYLIISFYYLFQVEENKLICVRKEENDSLSSSMTSFKMKSSIHKGYIMDVILFILNYLLQVNDNQSTPIKKQIAGTINKKRKYDEFSNIYHFYTFQAQRQKKLKTMSILPLRQKYLRRMMDYFHSTTLRSSNLKMEKLKKLLKTKIILIQLSLFKMTEKLKLVTLIPTKFRNSQIKVMTRTTYKLREISN